MVKGHIDGVGKLQERQDLGPTSGAPTRGDEFLKMTFLFPKEICENVVEKGSIAIDGISLTVNRVTANTVEVMVIPETLRKTTLGEKSLGDVVQVECDVIGKYIKKWMLQ